MRWQKLFPFLAWPRLTVAALGKDAWAGLSVGLVLIPQSLAYATLAGMPPETGLYAALLPALVGILWGSSPLLAVGPVALTSLLTFASIQPLAPVSSVLWVQMAIWLAVYAGLMQCMLGAFRLGAIANFVSLPVISGFINAAAVIIIVSQVPALLGLPTRFDADWLGLAGSRLQDDAPRVASVAVFGLGALVFLVAQKRLAPRWPGVLIVCAAGITASMLTGLGRNVADVVGVVPRGLPLMYLPPALEWSQHRALLPAAMIIALISFTEAMSSCRTLSRKCGQPWDENQELIGQGLAKIASGLCGGFPVSGSFSRSALNLYVGAKSGWSTLFACACVVACLLWATPLLYFLPRAVLAAIIIVPVVGLLDLAVFGRLYRISRVDGALALLTFAVTLISVPYLHWGVFAGFFLSLICFLYRRARPRIIEVGLHADGTLRDCTVHALAAIAPHVIAVRMDAAITYITAPVLERFVMDRVAREHDLQAVLLCLSAANDIDATGVEMLRQLQANLHERGVALKFSGIKKQVAEVLRKTMILESAGRANVFATDRDAAAALSPKAMVG